MRAPQIFVLLVLASTAGAVTHVDPTGSDHASCGASGDACASLAFAVARAAAGDAEIALSFGDTHIVSNVTTAADLVLHGNSATLQCEAGARAFAVTAGRLSVKEATITDCGGAALDGGGVARVWDGASVALERVTIRHAQAASGGSLSLLGGASASLADCAVSNSSAVAGDGGFAEGGAGLQVRNSTFETLSATGSGGLYSLTGSGAEAAAVTLAGVNVSDVAVGGNGGLVAVSGTASLTGVLANSAVTSVAAAGASGGLWYTYQTGATSLALSDVAVADVTALMGGLAFAEGTASDDCDIAFTDVTMLGVDVSAGYGAGVRGLSWNAFTASFVRTQAAQTLAGSGNALLNLAYAATATVDIDNCTVTDTTLVSGGSGGLATFYQNTASTVTLANSRVVGVSGDNYAGLFDVTGTNAEAFTLAVTNSTVSDVTVNKGALFSVRYMATTAVAIDGLTATGLTGSSDAAIGHFEYSGATTVSMTDSALSAITTGGAGGLFYFNQGTLSTLDVARLTADDINTASNGGLLFLYQCGSSAVVTVSDATLTNFVVGGEGGVMYARGSGSGDTVRSYFNDVTASDFAVTGSSGFVRNYYNGNVYSTFTRVTASRFDVTASGGLSDTYWVWGRTELYLYDSDISDFTVGGNGGIFNGWNCGHNHNMAFNSRLRNIAVTGHGGFAITYGSGWQWMDTYIYNCTVDNMVAGAKGGLFYTENAAYTLTRVGSSVLRGVSSQAGGLAFLTSAGGGNAEFTNLEITGLTTTSGNGGLINTNSGTSIESVTVARCNISDVSVTGNGGLVRINDPNNFALTIADLNATRLAVTGAGALAHIVGTSAETLTADISDVVAADVSAGLFYFEAVTTTAIAVSDLVAEDITGGALLQVATAQEADIALDRCAVSGLPGGSLVDFAGAGSHGLALSVTNLNATNVGGDSLVSATSTTSLTGVLTNAVVDTLAAASASGGLWYAYQTGTTTLTLADLAVSDLTATAGGLVFAEGTSSATCAVTVADVVVRGLDVSAGWAAGVRGVTWSSFTATFDRLDMAQVDSGSSGTFADVAFVTSAALSADNCTIADSAISGGGNGGAMVLYDVDSGSMSLTNSRVSNVVGADRGGLLFSHGTYSQAISASMLNCTVSGISSATGALIMFRYVAWSNVVVDSVMASDLTATDGRSAAVYLYQGGASAVSITNSAFSGLSSGADGGGLFYAYQGDLGAGPLLLARLTVDGVATTGSGGLVLLSGVGNANVEFTDVAVTSATVSGNGGLLSATGGSTPSVELTRVTVDGLAATGNGGLVYLDEPGSTAVTLASVVVRDLSAALGGLVLADGTASDDCVATLTDVDVTDSTVTNYGMGVRGELWNSFHATIRRVTMTGIDTGLAAALFTVTYVGESDVLVDDCNVTNVVTDLSNGGLVNLWEVDSGSMALTNSHVTNLVGPDRGGLLFAHGTYSEAISASVLNCTVSGISSATGTLVMFRYVGSSTVVVDSVTASDLTATDGRSVAVYLYQGGTSAVSITNSAFSGLSSGADGGGLFYAYQGDFGASPLLLARLTVDDMACGGSGALAFMSDTDNVAVEVTDVVMNNVAVDHGGVVFAYNGATVTSVELTRVAVNGLTATGDGGLVFLQSTGTTSPLTFTDVSLHDATVAGKGGLLLSTDGVISAIDVTRVNATNVAVSGDGGLVYVTTPGTDLTVTVADVSVDDLSADEGGLVYAEGTTSIDCTVTFTDVTAANVLAASSSGFVRGYSWENFVITMHRVTASGVTVTTGSGGLADVYTVSSVTTLLTDNCTFSDFSVGNNGGLFNQWEAGHANIDILNSHLTDVYVGSKGGLILTHGTYAEWVNANIKNCTIERITSVSNGPLIQEEYQWGGALVIDSVTVRDAASPGGAGLATLVWAGWCSASLTNLDVDGLTLSGNDGGLINVYQSDLQWLLVARVVAANVAVSGAGALVRVYDPSNYAYVTATDIVCDSCSSSTALVDLTGTGWEPLAATVSAVRSVGGTGALFVSGAGSGQQSVTNVTVVDGTQSVVTIASSALDLALSDVVVRGGAPDGVVAVSGSTGSATVTHVTAEGAALWVGADAGALTLSVADCTLTGGAAGLVATDAALDLTLERVDVSDAAGDLFALSGAVSSTLDVSDVVATNTTGHGLSADGLSSLTAAFRDVSLDEATGAWVSAAACDSLSLSWANVSLTDAADGLLAATETGALDAVVQSAVVSGSALLSSTEATGGAASVTCVDLVADSGIVDLIGHAELVSVSLSGVSLGSAGTDVASVVSTGAVDVEMEHVDVAHVAGRVVDISGASHSRVALADVVAADVGGLVATAAAYNHTIDLAGVVVDGSQETAVVSASGGVRGTVHVRDVALTDGVGPLLLLDGDGVLDEVVVANATLEGVTSESGFVLALSSTRASAVTLSDVRVSDAAASAYGGVVYAFAQSGGAPHGVAVNLSDVAVANASAASGGLVATVRSASHATVSVHNATSAADCGAPHAVAVDAASQLELAVGDSGLEGAFASGALELTGGAADGWRLDVAYATLDGSALAAVASLTGAGAVSVADATAANCPGGYAVSLADSTVDSLSLSAANVSGCGLLELSGCTTASELSVTDVTVRDAGAVGAVSLDGDSHALSLQRADVSGVDGALTGGVVGFSGAALELALEDVSLRDSALASSGGVVYASGTGDVTVSLARVQARGVDVGGAGALAYAASSLAAVALTVSDANVTAASSGSDGGLVLASAQQTCDVALSDIDAAQSTAHAMVSVGSQQSADVSLTRVAAAPAGGALVVHDAPDGGAVTLRDVSADTLQSVVQVVEAVDDVLLQGVCASTLSAAAVEVADALSSVTVSDSQVSGVTRGSTGSGGLVAVSAQTSPAIVTVQRVALSGVSLGGSGGAVWASGQVSALTVRDCNVSDVAVGEQGGLAFALDLDAAAAIVIDNVRLDTASADTAGALFAMSGGSSASVALSDVWVSQAEPELVSVSGATSEVTVTAAGVDMASVVSGGLLAAGSPVAVALSDVSGSGMGGPLVSLSGETCTGALEFSGVSVSGASAGLLRVRDAATASLLLSGEGNAVSDTGQAALVSVSGDDSAAAVEASGLTVSDVTAPAVECFGEGELSLLLQDATLQRIAVDGDGGAVFVEDASAELRLVDVALLDATVVDRGALLHAAKASVAANLTRVTAHNFVAGDVGGLVSLAESDVGALLLDRVEAINGSATSGGLVSAAVSDLAGALELRASTVQAVVATSGDGGALLVDSRVPRVVVEDCVLDGCSAAGLGGALHATGSDVSVRRSAVSRSEGSALAVTSGARLTVADCALTDNAGDEGGAVVVERSSALTLLRTELSGNSATSGDGGAVLVAGSSSANVSDVEATGNRAAAGSGGFLALRDSASVALRETTLADNEASGGGGGVAMDASFSCANLTLGGGVLFEHNSALMGGAVYWEGEHACDLSEAVFEDNEAAGFGGDFATEPVALWANVSSLRVQSGALLPTFTVWLLDAYGQIVEGARETVVIVESPAGGEFAVQGQTAAFGSDAMVEFSAAVATGPMEQAANFSLVSIIPSDVDDARVEVYIDVCNAGAVRSEGADSCVQCGVGEYSWDPLATSCASCPDGAYCPGGADVIALDGYWRVSAEHDEFYTCFQAGHCLGYPSTLEEECADNTAGVLCGQCADGYAKSMGACHLCPDKASARVTLAFVFLACCGILALIFHFSERFAAGGRFKTVVNGMHTVTAIVSFNLPWPGAITSAASVLSLSNASVFSIVPMDCGGKLDYFVGWALQQAFLPLIMLVVWLRQRVYWARKFGPKEARHAMRREGVVMLLLFWPGMAGSSITYFKCTTVDDKQFLDADLEVRCDSDEWWQLAPLAALATFVYCCGIPMALYLILRANADRMDAEDEAAEEAEHEMGILYKPYTADHHYHELTIFLHKCALWTCSALLNEQRLLQALIGVFLSLAMYARQMATSPFVDPSDNHMADLTLLLSLVLSISGLVLSAEAVDIESWSWDASQGLTNAVTAIIAALIARQFFIEKHVGEAAGGALKRMSTWRRGKREEAKSGVAGASASSGSEVELVSVRPRLPPTSSLAAEPAVVKAPAALGVVTEDDLELEDVEGVAELAASEEAASSEASAPVTPQRAMVFTDLFAKAGAEEADAAAEEADAAAEEADAGAGEADAGAGEADAGAEEPDAGAEEPVAGAEEPDGVAELREPVVVKDDHFDEAPREMFLEDMSEGRGDGDGEDEEQDVASGAVVETTETTI